MDSPAKLIGVVQGTPGAAVQALLETLVDRWRQSARVAGVIAQAHGLADRACSAGFLRSIATGERFAIFEDQGPGAPACHLAGAGVRAAAEAVQRDIAAGCDLVVFNKFGKLEAAQDGLFDAFKAAIEARVPVLTSVSANAAAAWARLAAPWSVVLPADIARVDAWWREIGAPPLGTARWAGPADGSPAALDSGRRGAMLI